MLEDVERIINAIYKFQDSKQIEKENLYIDMQIDSSPNEESYFVEYGITDLDSRSCTGLNPKIYYNSMEEAWDSYTEQLEEITEEFTEAHKLVAEPEEYQATAGGGNPAKQIKKV
ncbi:MAG: hypothetical protein BRC29_00095 [Nanohaloarchaea archaeon SW_7_43_1]|nr:MAG: hypothetical protein BRC29_00095 [Nanohaloarchaea archaeon SW_7_43_1]